MTRTIAILTGDLIGSTEVPPQAIKAAMTTIAACAAELDPDSRFTRYRGDGWQLRLPKAGDCLFACLLILARLGATPGAATTRIAVGLGGEDQTDGPDLSSAMGPAYTASGRALDQMHRDEVLTLDGAGVDDFQKLCFAFAADQARQWTTEQAQAMALVLTPDGPTHADIAARLHITRQAVSQRLKSARHKLLEDAMLAFMAKYPRQAQP